MVRYYGFRSGHNVPDRFPASSGLARQLLQVATPPSASEAPAALAVWNKLALSSRDLTIVDVSSAMAQPASPSDPTGPTFELELTQTASLGLALFPDTANIGLWEFADHLDHGLPYKQLVSVGPLPENLGVFSRRAQLQRINGSLPPDGGPHVALYGTILDAYRYMQKTYKPKFFNTVIVLASGLDNAPGDITAQQLLKTLTRLSNSPRKVAVIIISFSPSADFRDAEEDRAHHRRPGLPDHRSVSGGPGFLSGPGPPPLRARLRRALGKPPAPAELPWSLWTRLVHTLRTRRPRRSRPLRGPASAGSGSAR